MTAPIPIHGKFTTYHLRVDTFISSRKSPFSVIEVPPGGHPERQFCDHDFSELVLITAGAARHLVEHESYPVARGDILCLHPGFFHAYENAESMSLINVIFDLRHLEYPAFDCRRSRLFNRIFPVDSARLNAAMLVKPILHADDGLLDTLIGGAHELEQELRDRRPGSYFCSMALFFGLIARLLRCRTAADEEDDIPERFRDLRDFLHANCAEPLNVEQLALRSGMSKRSFYRHFREAFGLSPVEYLLALRLERATELLSRSELGIAEAAQAAGFDDQNYFGRQFRRRFGISPREFRRRNRDISE